MAGFLATSVLVLLIVGLVVFNYWFSIVELVALVFLALIVAAASFKLFAMFLPI